MNKSKIGIIVLLLLLTIGFATITANLFINNRANISSNPDDFNVIFYSAITEDNSTAIISQDMKTITYSTKQLVELGDKSILDYEVKNNSAQYDANIHLIVNIESQYNDYLRITYEGFNESDTTSILAKEIKSGKITIELIKPFIEDTAIPITVILDTSASGRTSYGVDPCNGTICEWLRYEKYDRYPTDEVLTDTTKITNLINNEEAMEFLVNNEDVKNELKSSEYYEEYIVPAFLAYDKISTTNNTKMYNAKLPAYAYDYGTYYLISGFSYVGPSNSCQSRSVSNTAANGYYFYLVGTTSASQSVGTSYSNQNINPYGYTKLNIDYYFNTSLPSFDTSQFYLANGSTVSQRWEGRFSGTVAGLSLQIGEHSGYINLSNLNYNSNFRLTLQQLVNQYQRSGNYNNQVYLRRAYLS